VARHHTREGEALVLSVGGMTCSGCERRIEKAVGVLPGVRDVRARFSSGKLIVSPDSTATDRSALRSSVVEAVESLGYRIDSAGAFGVKQLIGITIVLIAVFFVLQRTGLLNRIPQIDPSMGYGVLFVVGILTSVHCIGMCGGINLSQTVRGRVGDPTRLPGTLSRLRPGLLYNAGRVISYTAVGGAVGALGSLVSFSGAARGWLVFAVGLFMLLMGLNMLDLFPWLRKITPRLPGALGRRLSGLGGSRGPFIVGLLNGFMPCGPLQSVQLYALATGSFVAGALSMLLFSLGTVPLMFGLGALGSLLTARFTRRMVQVSALIVMLLGVAMAGRGLNQTGNGIAAIRAGLFPGPGLFPGLSRSSAQSASGNVARIENGVQVVRSRVGASSYEPIIVQKGIPVRWTIEAEASALNGCNNPVTIPEYDKVVRMVPGDNLVEFTPEREGNLLYTCWMGMITSTIRVVGDLAAVTGQDIEEANRFAAAGESGSGSCCAGGAGTAASGPLELDANYRIQTGKVAVAEIVEGMQRVSVTVDSRGYSPAVIVVQRGVPVEWTFDASELNDENYRLIIRAYQARFELGEGENTLAFDPTFDFTFDNWTNSLHGYVKVVEDLDALDLKEIRSQVSAFADGIREQAKAQDAATAPAGGTQGGADSL
jgi:sulfite exporter TauE/SafE/copper chaperone CopZ